MLFIALCFSLLASFYAKRFCVFYIIIWLWLVADITHALIGYFSDHYASGSPRPITDYAN